MNPTPAVATPASSTRSFTGLASFSLVAGPALWFVGWVLMRVKGHVGSGAAWTAAHALWIAAFALFGFAMVALHRSVRPETVGVKAISVTGLIVGIGGMLAVLAQMVIDIYVGFAVSATQTSGELYDKFFDIPGVEILVFQIGPLLLYVGLIILPIVAAARRAIPAAAAVLIGIGIAMSAAGHGMDGILRYTEGLGMLILMAGLIIVARASVKR